MEIKLHLLGAFRLLVDAKPVFAKSLKPLEVSLNAYYQNPFMPSLPEVLKSKSLFL